MTHRTKTALALAVVLAFGATTALAADVILNGKKITGMSNVDFGKVGVKLDAAGNVLIDAPEFKVQEVAPAGAKAATPPPKAEPTPPPNPAGLENHYFIVTEGSMPGGTGYDVKLMINNKFIKVLPDTIPQHVVELNEFFKKGANSVSFLAERKARSAKSVDATFTLMIGIGDATGGALSIESVLHEFKLSAADPPEKAKTFTLVAK